MGWRGVRGVRATDAAVGADRLARAAPDGRSPGRRASSPGTTGLVIGDRGRPHGVRAGAGVLVRAWRRSRSVRRGRPRIADHEPRSSVAGAGLRPKRVEGQLGRRAGRAAQRVGGGIRKPAAGLEAVGRPRVPGLDGRQGHAEVVGDAEQVVARADHVDVAVGRVRARLQQRVPARGRLGRRLRRRCRGGGRWPDWASGVGDAVGLGVGRRARDGVGLGVGAAVAAAVAVASGVAAADVAVGAAVSTSPRTAPVGPAGAAAVRVSPPLATTNATDRRKAPTEASDGPGDRRGHDPRRRDSVERLGARSSRRAGSAGS